MNKLRLTILAIVASIFANSAYAFDPDDLKKLKDTNKCVECDLSSAYLMEADLKGAALSKANLKGTILSYAIMNGAILCNTTMPDGSVIYSGC